MLNSKVALMLACAHASLATLSRREVIDNGMNLTNAAAGGFGGTIGLGTHRSTPDSISGRRMIGAKLGNPSHNSPHIGKRQVARQQRQHARNLANATRKVVTSS